ncbi:glycosyltransferase [Sporanaerobium hydrogeniformans]|uniref:Glycosyltransferase n=1 Tax=Sporanaerobium hydrogeniformans TaxID=3072179 RepID=A0AC61DGM0_9FIRM|nr:glycosyltransferase family 2 protein [Sporanaerobium hydrogeniformans]PHV72331.1 glycosyltransferase [Sporanaerobium hydrogeniformans]
MKPLISVIVPMYFEEKIVEICYTRLTQVMSKETTYDYELLFINDGSKDATLTLLLEKAKQDRHVKVISFSRNFGHQAAVSCGIAYAKGEALVIIDADLQDPPELIPQMLNLWKQGNEVVYGKRKRRKGETWFKLTTAKIFYRLLGWLTEVEIPVDTGDFRLIDRKVAEVIKALPEHNRFLRGLVAWTGFRQIPLVYEREARFAGETKYPLKKMIHFALDGIFSFSAKPLKLIINIGLLAVLVSLGVLIYSLVAYLSTGISTVRGWTSLMVVITFLGGVQLVSIGILGEYIGRMYDESKGRPLYIVDKTYNIERQDE